MGREPRPLELGIERGFLVAATLVVLLMGGAFFVRFFAAHKRIEFPTHALAMRAVESCPAAAEALGVPIERIDMPSGETGPRDASWTFSVKGPRGRGLLQYDARKRGDEWVLTLAQISVAGTGIDVLACKHD